MAHSNFVFRSLKKLNFFPLIKQKWDYFSQSAVKSAGSQCKTHRKSWEMHLARASFFSHWEKIFSDAKLPRKYHFLGALSVFSMGVCFNTGDINLHYIICTNAHFMQFVLWYFHLVFCTNWNHEVCTVILRLWSMH